ncbi:MAG: hypothetical protein PUB09_02265 [Firmicutes bacterium]|nr:hypothetical protein [Bacillota bacterium]
MGQPRCPYLCYTKTTNDGELLPGSSVIFQCMKKGRRPSDYFSLTRQPLSILRDEIEDCLDTFYCTFCGTKVIFESQSNAAYRAKVELKEMQHAEIMLEKRIEQGKYLMELKQKAFVKK